MGDKNQVGKVLGKNVVVGSHGYIESHEGFNADELSSLLEPVFDRLARSSSSTPDNNAAKQVILEIEEEVAKGEDTNLGWLAQRLINLSSMSSDILDVVTACLLNPAVGLALTTRKIVNKARQEAGLEVISHD